MIDASPEDLAALEQVARTFMERNGSDALNHLMFRKLQCQGLGFLVAELDRPLTKARYFPVASTMVLEPPPALRELIKQALAFMQRYPPPHFFVVAIHNATDDMVSLFVYMPAKGALCLPAHFTNPNDQQPAPQTQNPNTLNLSPRRVDSA